MSASTETCVQHLQGKNWGDDIIATKLLLKSTNVNITVSHSI